MENYKIKPDYKPYPTSKNNTSGEERNYWDEATIKTNKFYQWHVYEYARNMISSDDIVFDVGCGPADKLMYLAKKTSCRVVGFDQPSIVLKNQSRHGGKATFLACDFEVDNPLKLIDTMSPSFIVCSDVIEHMHDPDSLLRFIKKLASNKTTFIISTPDRDSLRGKSCTAAEKPEHIREWNKEEFLSYLDDRGFKIIQSVSSVPLKLTWSNLKTYMQIFIRQITSGDGRRFRYNHIVTCKLK